jgi:hypothetical protein
MMIILDSTVPSLAMVGRLVEVHYLLAANPGQQVSFIEDASLSKMDKGEKLFLLGHGDPGTLGDAWSLTPTELAVTLLNKGLKDHTYVVLGSCSGGVPDVHRGTSYFEEFMAAVWAEGALKVEGEAYTGVTAITAQGVYLTKDPLLNTPLQQQAYGQIINTNLFELNQAVLLLTRLNARKMMTTVLKAEAMKEATDTTFQALFLHNHGVRKAANAVQRLRLRLV